MCWGGLKRQDVPEKSSIQVKLRVCVSTHPETEIELCAGQSLGLRGVCVSAIQICRADMQWLPEEPRGADKHHRGAADALSVHSPVRREDKRFHYCRWHTYARRRKRSCMPTYKNTHMGRAHTCLKIGSLFTGILLAPSTPHLLAVLTFCLSADSVFLLCSLWRFGSFELTNQNLIPSYHDLRLVNVSL